MRRRAICLVSVQGMHEEIEKGADRYARIVAGQRMWYHGGCWPQAAVDAEIKRLQPTPRTSTGRPTRTQQTLPVYVDKKNKRQRLDGEGRLAEHASTTDCTQLGTRILWWLQELKTGCDEQMEDGDEDMEEESESEVRRNEDTDTADDERGHEHEHVHEPAGIG